MLIGRETEAGASGVGELGAAFAVALLGALDFRNAFADDRLGDDQLRLTGGCLLGAVNGRQNRGLVVAVGEELHVPTDRLEALDDIFALRLVSHRIEVDVVRVVNED